MGTAPLQAPPHTPTHTPTKRYIAMLLPAVDARRAALEALAPAASPAKPAAAAPSPAVDTPTRRAALEALLEALAPPAKPADTATVSPVSTTDAWAAFVKKRQSSLKKLTTDVDSPTPTETVAVTIEPPAEPVAPATDRPKTSEDHGVNVASQLDLARQGLERLKANRVKMQKA